MYRPSFHPPPNRAGGTRSTWEFRSDSALDHQLLDLGDRLARVQTLGAGLGAVHDGVAAIEPERVLEEIQPLARRLVAAVGDPAPGVQQRRRTHVAIAIPPPAGAGGRAAGAEDALVIAVKPVPVFDGLAPLGLRRRRGGLEPGHDRRVLREEV